MHIEFLIKNERLSQNITLSQLARKSGVSISHLSDIENERKNPSLFVMIKIAKALGVGITDLYKVKW